MARKKPQKYAAVCSTLPRFPGDDPKRLDLLTKVKGEVLTAIAEGTVSSPEAIVTLRAQAQATVEQMFALEKLAAGHRYAAQFARVYADLRSLKSQIATWESGVQLLVDAYQSLMIEQMEVEGVSSLRLADERPVTTFREPYGQVVDREACRQWCLKAGLERKMVLPPPTLSALVKEILVAAGPTPDGVDVYFVDKVRLGSE